MSLIIILIIIFCIHGNSLTVTCVFHSACFMQFQSKLAFEHILHLSCIYLSFILFMSDSMKESVKSVALETLLRGTNSSLSEGTQMGFPRQTYILTLREIFTSFRYWKYLTTYSLSFAIMKERWLYHENIRLKRKVIGKIWVEKNLNLIQDANLIVFLNDLRQRWFHCPLRSQFKDM